MGELIVPLYEYLCETCGYRCELEKKINDPNPECDHFVQMVTNTNEPRDKFDKPPKVMKKLISISSFQLKGKWAKEGY